MTLPEIIITVVVAFIGLPAATRNATAFALVLMWAAGELAWMVSGNNIPLRVYFMADIAVIVTVYARSITRCGNKVYDGCATQLRCTLTDLTICDRIIVLIFVLGIWPIYVLKMDAYIKWHLLWALTVVQFLAAGLDTFLSWREAKRADPKPDTPQSGLLRLTGVEAYD